MDNSMVSTVHHEEKMLTSIPRWKILSLGQLIAFLYTAAGGIQSSMSLQCNWSAPTFSLGCMNAVLALLLIRLAYQRYQKQGEYKHKFMGVLPVEGHPLAYAGIGLVELEAFYFMLKALKYTTLTSVTILISLSTPSTMFFSKVFQNRQYTYRHVTGALFCMVGTALAIVHDSDSESAGADHYDNKLWGDLFAILSGIVFGLSDVFYETAVQNFGGPIECLGMKGLFAALFAFVQVSFTEKQQVMQLFDLVEDESMTCSRQVVVAYFAGVVAVLVSTDLLITYFLEISEVALLSVSHLTENIWSVVFTTVFQGIVPGVSFFVALVLTGAGVIIYDTAPSPRGDSSEYELTSMYDDIIPEEETTQGELRNHQVAIV